jgi:UDP-N-acetylmuramate--alanine ligase
MFNRYRVIHFVGIGGIGMSGIAEVLKTTGYEVTGSDAKDSATLDRLRALGVAVHVGHRAENVAGAHVVVVSSAVGRDNPEVVEAVKRAIPVIPRAEMLAELGRLKYGILVAGSHGKTTTTSLISTILINAGFDPTVVIGGKLQSLGTNALSGKGEYFVAEADESDGSFLKLNPTVAVCTNVDHEHMDYFGSMDAIKKAFTCFLNKVPFYGNSVVCIDDPNVREILPRINRRYVTYGFSEDAEYRPSGLEIAEGGRTSLKKTSFELFGGRASMGRFESPLTGRHNVLNCAAAAAVAAALNVDVEVIRRSLAGFGGIKRRLEYKGTARGVKVFDDYGHHPTEIRATIRGIKDCGQERLFVVFQPHRYTRTKDLMEEFGRSFSDVKRLYLMDVYSAGEKPIEGVSAGRLCDMVRAEGVDVVYVGDAEEAVRSVRRDAGAGDVLVTIGAGDVFKVGEDFLRRANGNGA